MAQIVAKIGPLGQDDKAFITDLNAQKYLAQTIEQAPEISSLDQIFQEVSPEIVELLQNML